MYQILFFNARIFAKEEPILFKITLQNKRNWEYLCSNRYNEDFNKIIRLTRWVKLNNLNFDIINWSVKDKFIDILH